MSEPNWELLGGGGIIGGPIDYVGDWAAGVTYQPGQIVRYGGLDYLAVNPSIGQIPPIPYGSPAGPRLARVRRDINDRQSIPNGVLTYIVYDTEDGDVGNFWDVAQPTRLTAVEAGWYRVRTKVTWDGASGVGYREVQLHFNRSWAIGYEVVNANSHYVNAPHMEINAMFQFATGQYVEVAAYQNSGGALWLNAGDGNFYNGFEIERIA